MTRRLPYLLALLLAGACADLKSASPQGSTPADGSDDDGDDTTDGSPTPPSEDAGPGDGDSAGNGDPRWPQWKMPRDYPQAEDFDIDNSPDGRVITDKTTGLTWANKLPDASMSWEDASAWCEELDFGDKDDWRLPTRIEAISVASFDSESGFLTIQPQSKTAFTPATGSDPCFWTASTFPKSAAHWRVWNDRIGDYSTAQTCFPRCVRGGPAIGEPKDPAYELKNGLIWDPRTKLLWEAKPQAAKTTWESAVDRCNALVIDGHKMRLPWIKELASIVDETRTAQALHPDLAVPSLSDRMFTRDHKVIVNFYDGQVESNDTTAGSRCVAAD